MLRFLDSADKVAAYQDLKREMPGFLREQGVDTTEIRCFDRFLKEDIFTL